MDLLINCAKRDITNLQIYYANEEDYGLTDQLYK